MHFKKVWKQQNQLNLCLSRVLITSQIFKRHTCQYFQGKLYKWTLVQSQWHIVNPHPLLRPTDNQIKPGQQIFSFITQSYIRRVVGKLQLILSPPVRTVANWMMTHWHLHPQNALLQRLRMRCSFTFLEPKEESPNCCPPNSYEQIKIKLKLK